MDPCKKLRALSVAAFGPPSDSVKVLLNGSIEGIFQCLEGAVEGNPNLESLVQTFPFLERLFSAPVTPPPKVPKFVHNNMAASVSSYIKECRLYRKKFPTYDKATKMNQKYPTNASTGTKFDLGISTAGCTHLGAGRVTGSSVPDAKIFVDWMQNTDAFLHEVDTEMVVSDLAIPDEDGLGCGTYPALLRMIRDWVEKGKFVLVKLNILDYYELVREGYNINILYKPRKHNLEMICSLNIPGVGLDEVAVLEGIFAENISRNDQIYQQNCKVEKFEKIDVELLADDKDYDSMVEGLNFDKLGVYAVELEKTSAPTPETLGTLIDIGFNKWHDQIDAKAYLELTYCIERFEKHHPIRIPEFYEEVYASWSEESKKARRLKLSDYWAIGAENRGVHTIPLARLAIEMHMYSAEKINTLIQILVLNQLGKLLLMKRGLFVTARDLEAEYVSYRRN